MIKVGDKAPDFTLNAAVGDKRQDVSLAELRAQNDFVVLSFYPMDWTPVCFGQAKSFQSELQSFRSEGAAIVGISVDSVYSHIAWQEKAIGATDYPLASDFFPHGAVAQQFGLLRTGQPISGICERAVVVVDKEGIVRYVQVYDLGEQPRVEEILGSLKALRAGEQAAAGKS